MDAFSNYPKFEKIAVEASLYAHTFQFNVTITVITIFNLANYI